MFLFDSAIKAIEMRIPKKIVEACTACMITGVPTVTLAQEAIGESQRAESIQGGYRVATLSNGFQLVEHGVWSDREATVQNGQSTMEGPAVPTAFQKSPMTARHPSGFRRAGYLPHIYAAEAQFALPPGLLDALVWTESRYNPFAISKAGAVGLGQLMPGTARDMGVTNRYDPKANIYGAARYLRQMIDKFRVVHLALAAYNAGPQAVERAGGIPKNGETPSYVRNVLRRWHF